MAALFARGLLPVGDDVLGPAPLEPGLGCANHPSVEQQGELGSALADELSLYLGW